MSRSSLIKSIVVLFLGLGSSVPCWARDSLLLINRINLGKSTHAKSGSLDLSVSIDGMSFGDCTAESDVHVMCEGVITPGKHRIAVQAKGGKPLAKAINVRAEDGAMFWAGVPDDVRLWCIAVTKSSLVLMSKSACWDVENGR
jgi:hypothetical protein